ncbi:bifunctional precorrin-2 dehydrogenase/sirohydrochlorin ferrochelatase [Paenibacillus sp. SI8]|uniref:precorrin-2 dehydrogenase/sirohydrochlorin ferrochelatase family protein n=1 Tax=unclassified Paenibacillus TaxID=185978 RepID=UPI003466DC36
MKHQYPIVLNVQGHSCLIVGGGKIAERKALSLVGAGARVTVLSPECSDGLVEMERRGLVVIDRRTYSPSAMLDIVSNNKGKVPFMLVVAATNRSEVNEAVYKTAIEEGLLVNVVDQPELSSFILPSVVRRGKLVIAVSTGGASPSLGRKIAKELEDAYGDEYESYLDFLSEARLKVQQRVEDGAFRQQIFKEMLEWDVLSKIRSGTFEPWKNELFTAIDHEFEWSTIKGFGFQL